MVKTRKSDLKKQKIYEMYEAGKTISEIAEKTGYKESSVRIYINKAGYNKKKFFDDCIKEILKMRSEGKSLREISQKTGLSESTISKRLCKLGYHQYTKRGVEESREEYDLSKLTYAIKTKPKIYPIISDGKRYIDITEVILSET